MQQDPKQRTRDRIGLTLIELLVTISIMATVAGMFVIAYRGAATEANNIKTASTIRKISEVLNSRMQEYENTPISFSPPIPGNAFTTTAESRAILVERARLLALREMITTEMPDHPDDLALLPMTRTRPTGLAYTNSARVPINVYAHVPATSRATRLKTLLSTPNWTLENANAELLYLIVEDSTLNGSSAIELFGRSEIADLDSDGFNEFVDTYRRPIQWIRWPTGFAAIYRFIPDPWDSMMTFNAIGELEGEPFDRLQADPGYRVGSPVALRPGIATFPLVVSSGVDGRLGIRLSLDGVRSSEPEYEINSRSAKDVKFPVPYEATQSPLIMPDPWFPRDNRSLRLGSIIDDKAFEDDITNYSSNGASL